MDFWVASLVPFCPEYILKLKKFIRGLYKLVMSAESEKNGVKIVVNGKMQVEEVKLNSALSQEQQEQIIKECINDAMKKLQTIMASKMSGMPCCRSPMEKRANTVNWQRR